MYLKKTNFARIVWSCQPTAVAMPSWFLRCWGRVFLFVFDWAFGLRAIFGFVRSRPTPLLAVFLLRAFSHHRFHSCRQVLRKSDDSRFLRASLWVSPRMIRWWRASFRFWCAPSDSCSYKQCPRLGTVRAFLFASKIPNLQNCHVCLARWFFRGF